MYQVGEVVIWTNTINLGLQTSHAHWLVSRQLPHLVNTSGQEIPSYMSFLVLIPGHSHYAYGQRDILGGISLTSTSARDSDSHLAIYCCQGRYVHVR